VTRDLLDDLNAAQRDAVTHGEGPLLVLAGAGSGKTRVLTYRVAHLVRAGMTRPHQITAVTFTNKAAREMRDRVERLMGGRLEGAFVGTFHRWALEILRRHPSEVGLRPRFAILDSDDQRALILRCLKDLGHDPKLHQPRSVLGRISAAANRCQEPDDLERRVGDPHRAVVAEVWCRYRTLKRESDAVDFDDMLVLARRVLDNQPQIGASASSSNGRSSSWSMSSKTPTGCRWSF